MGFDIWLLLAGIGILIYGMNNFEEALNYLWGKKLKYLLQKYTKTAWTAIWTGTWTTTLLQSSTLVSLLTLAFTGAGLMTLPSAIGVILGANIGSPMLPLFAALIGFGEFDIGRLALPLIGAGALILMFIKDERWQWYAKLLIWFGLFFVGIGWMKESVDMIKASFDIEQYKYLPLWWFGILGAVFSAMMSSSGALGIITLAAVASWVVTFEASVAIMMWANIGTTRTAFLASMGGARIKRQVAMSHVLFNGLSTIIGAIFFYQYIRISNEFFGLKDNPALSNAVLNVVYNVTTCILFGIFIKPFTKLVIWTVPDRKDEKNKLHIQQLEANQQSQSFVWAQTLALDADSKDLLEKTIAYTGYIYGISWEKCKPLEFNADVVLATPIAWRKQEHIHQYEQIKNDSDIMLTALLHLKSLKKGKDNALQVHHIETTLYSCIKAIKAIKNIRHELIDLRETMDPKLQQLFKQSVEMLIVFYRHLANVTQRHNSVVAYEELTHAFGVIKHIHAEFMHLFLELGNTWALEDVHVTTLINVDHYMYEACEMIFIATMHTYLSDEEVTHLEMTVDVDEEIYESFSTNIGEK